MKFVAAVLLFANLGLPLSQPSCKCKKARKDQTTYISSTHVELDERRLRKIEGQAVTYGDSPIEGALVEVFTRPEFTSKLAIGAAERERKQKRVAACITGEDGSFCFPSIPAGRYELRISKREWEFATGVIIVDPKKRRSNDDKVRVFLTLAI